MRVKFIEKLKILNANNFEIYLYKLQMQEMNALVKHISGPGLELQQVPIPEPGPGEVLIKIHKSSICGTDVHIYNWDEWAQQHIKPPVVIGHEYVGEIFKVGEGCTKYKVGQRVSGEGHITCRKCEHCQRGDIQFCEETISVGVNRSGAFAEYVCIPECNVIEIDESFPEEFVSFFDAFGNATHASMMWELKNKAVLITGAGPIGIMSAGICKHKGARLVVITDVNDYRLELAKKMGADVCVNLSKCNLKEVLSEYNIGKGFDVGLEMSGNGKALKDMINLVRNGGEISLLGLSGQPIEVDMSKIILKGLRLQGVYGRKVETWKQMSEMVREGFDMRPLITHRYHYTEFKEAFEKMSSGYSGKIVLDWTTKEKDTTITPSASESTFEEEKKQKNTESNTNQHLC